MKSSTMDIMRQNALHNLYSGALMPWDKQILEDMPLPADMVDPFASEDVKPLSVMNLTYVSLTGWIADAKKEKYYSERFVELSKLVMKGVTTIGRGLVTLHKRGEDLSAAPMQIDDLISVGSYHFRKSYLGVVQFSRKHPEIGERLLINQLSWADMLMRLYRTKEKLEAGAGGQCSVASGEAVASSQLPVAGGEAVAGSQLPVAGGESGSRIEEQGSSEKIELPVCSGQVRASDSEISALPGLDEGASSGAKGFSGLDAIFAPAAFSAQRALTPLGNQKSGKNEEEQLIGENETERKEETQIKEDDAEIKGNLQNEVNEAELKENPQNEENKSEIIEEIQNEENDAEVKDEIQNEVNVQKPEDGISSEGNQTMTDNETDNNLPTGLSGEYQLNYDIGDSSIKEQSPEKEPSSSEEDIGGNARSSNEIVDNPNTGLSTEEEQLSPEEVSGEAARSSIDDGDSPGIGQSANENSSSRKDDNREIALSSNDVSNNPDIGKPADENLSSLKDDNRETAQLSNDNGDNPAAGLFPKEEQTSAEHSPEEEPPGSDLPPYLQILQNVYARSGPSDDGRLTFTFDELAYLAADPDFNRIYPDQAVQMRSILQNMT